MEHRSDEQFINWFSTYLLTEKRVAQNTFLAYQRDVKQLLVFFHKKKLTIEQCSRRHLKNFLKELNDQGISAKSMSRKISAVKLFFNFLHDRYDVANKADVLIFPKVEQTLPLYLSDEEIIALFRASNEDTSPKGVRNKVMVHLLYASGMRVSELAHAKVDQIHFDTGFIQIMGKGDKERLIPLPKPTLALLRYYLDVTWKKLLPPKLANKEGYLFFTTLDGNLKAISRQMIWNIVKDLLLKAGITKNLSPHSLRHSLATHLLKNGANIRVIQMILGHESITTVQVYTHLEKSQIRKVYDEKHPRA